MDQAIHVAAIIFQKFCEFPFQHVWAVYLNQDQLKKNGIITNSENMSLFETLRYLAKERFSSFYRNFKWYLATSFGAPTASMCSMLLVEGIFQEPRSEMSLFLKECSRFLSSLLFTYPFQMLQFRSLIAVGDAPEVTLTSIKNQFAENGMSSLFRGFPCTAIGAFVYRPLSSFTMLVAQSLFGVDAGSQGGEVIEGFKAVGIQYMGAMATTVIVYPLDLVRRFSIINDHALASANECEVKVEERLTSEQSSQVMSVIKEISKKDGVLALWNGCATTIFFSTLRISALVAMEWMAQH